MPLDDRISAVTDRIIDRSRDARSTYLDRMRRLGRGGAAPRAPVLRQPGPCLCRDGGDKDALVAARAPNIGIVTAYNDMLSAHQPFKDYPDRIKEAARKVGATAQVAGGVPAMCDGVTQGQTGMELSLFSRDVIAMADGRGALAQHLRRGALSRRLRQDRAGPHHGRGTFGYLPGLFVPAGPMVSGLPNDEKAKVRQQFAAGEVGRDKLMEAEMASYHGPGTCTFYGTANSNQMLMEFMGLHLPGASFVNPGTPLRDALTEAATERAAAITALGNDFRPSATSSTRRPS
jgi:phosphogluconate dehydratase